MCCPLRARTCICYASPYPTENPKAICSVGVLSPFFWAVCTLGGMSNLLFMVQMLAPLTVSLAFAIVFACSPCGLVYTLGSDGSGSDRSRVEPRPVQHHRGERPIGEPIMNV